MYMNEIIYLKPYHVEFTFKNFSFQWFPFFACFTINILNAPVQRLQGAFIFLEQNYRMTFLLQCDHKPDCGCSAQRWRKSLKIPHLWPTFKLKCSVVHLSLSGLSKTRPRQCQSYWELIQDQHLQ